MIKEVCSCGATFEVSLATGYAQREMNAAAAWRADHQHEPIAPAIEQPTPPWGNVLRKLGVEGDWSSNHSHATTCGLARMCASWGSATGDHWMAEGSKDCSLCQHTCTCPQPMDVRPAKYDKPDGWDK